MKKVSFNVPETEKIIRALAKHPYLWAFALCMGVHFLFLSDITVFITSYSLFTGQIIVQLAGALVLFKLHDNKKLNFIGFILAELFYAAAVFLLFFLYSNDRRKILFVLAASVLTVTAIFAYLRKRMKTDSLKEQFYSLFIMCLGYTVKMSYSLATSSSDRQHDLWDMSGEMGNRSGGHFGYVEYLMYRHRLPSESDPRTLWQFYHPPLHHIISAVWVSFNEYVLGLSHGHAMVTIKTLCLFYSMCIMISCYRIFRLFGLKGSGLFVPLVIVNFAPQFIYFSGSMNNDVLSVAFMMGAIVTAIEWYRDRTMKNILKIALCIGLGMMTKMSAALIAPPVAVVFLAAFIKNIKKEWKTLIGQFACFGALCIPLGLWFGIRNYIKWGIPLNYVQELPTPAAESPYYCGGHTVLQRIFDFSPYQYSPKSIYCMMVNDAGHVEFNPLISAMKGAVFNEYADVFTFGVDKIFNVIAYVLFWVNVLIAAFAFYCMIRQLFKKTPAQGDFLEKSFLVIFYWILMVSFYVFSFRYPFSFTMNFRYISQVVPIGALFMGIFLTNNICAADASEAQKRRAAAVKRTVSVLVGLYALMSSVIVIAICCPHTKVTR